ncbi:unnamed protein product [Arctia plantaginis]|uniref:Uncharacterized protein n=1 Tax=Arctia plantaginis TaxID=874455 RepID=A0A8S1AIC4_ARCPL|nr:unnamed protein product [Arctia plantaginis]
MLMLVTVVMIDYVPTEATSESDFYEQLFKKTFHQDSLKINRNQPSRFEDEEYRAQMKIKMIKKKEIAKNMTQMTSTQETMKQQTVIQDNVIHKTHKELKVIHECTPDGKKCSDFEVDFTDREDHNTQLVDGMFVNTDNEITSIQAHEVEDPYFPSGADAQSDPVPNNSDEDAAFSR